MSNIWYAVADDGEVIAEFLSRDFDAYSPMFEDYRPVRIYDKTDGNKLITTLNSEED